jgi:type I restriction enzyme S subunit
MVSIRDLCDLGRGRVISGEEIERHPGTYPVFSSQSKDNGRMGAIDTFDFEGEYVTWTTDGAYAGTVFYRSGRFNCTNVCGTLSAKDPELSLAFLAYKLATVSKDHVSYVGNPKLMNGVMASIELLLPKSLPEQRKIAEILTTVDRAIEETEALVGKQQRIKTGLMQDLLTRGIDAHGQLRTEATHAFKDSPLGRIPVEWEVNLLDSLAERGSGHTPSKSRAAYWNGGIKWVSLADSSSLDQVFINDTDKEISELGLANSSAVLHPKGTVILSRDAGVGKSAILGSDMAVSQHFMAWRCRAGRLDNAFLYYWLQREKPKFEGIASGSTILTIGLQFFRDYKIAAPSDVNEQRRISARLLHADHTLKSFDLTLAKLRSLKTALMQDLLTGGKRVTGLL